MSRKVESEDNQIINQFIKRLISDFLDIIIIAQFKEEAFEVSDVVKYIEKQFHITISSGTIYSTVYAMERNGLLVGYALEFARMYKATAKGLHRTALLFGSEKVASCIEKIQGKQ